MIFRFINVLLFSFSNYLFSLPIIYFGLSSYSENEMKADWQPPGYVFGIVWPILYLLFGIINLKIYYSNEISKSSKIQNLEISFQESLIQTLWLLVNGKYGNERKCIQYYLGMIVMFYLLIYAYLLRIPLLFRIPDKSILLMYIPYTLWITFASILNYQLMKKCLDS